VAAPQMEVGQSHRSPAVCSVCGGALPIMSTITRNFMSPFLCIMSADAWSKTLAPNIYFYLRAPRARAHKIYYARCRSLRCDF